MLKACHELGLMAVLLVAVPATALANPPQSSTSDSTLGQASVDTPEAKPQRSLMPVLASVAVATLFVVLVVVFRLYEVEPPFSVRPAADDIDPQAVFYRLLAVEAQAAAYPFFVPPCVQVGLRHVHHYFEMGEYGAALYTIGLIEGWFDNH